MAWTLHLDTLCSSVHVVGFCVVVETLRSGIDVSSKSTGTEAQVWSHDVRELMLTPGMKHIESFSL